MPNNKCGDCQSFWPLQKGLKQGGTKPLQHGYCLKKTIFPKNKPGNPVYPPKATVQDLPYNRAKTHIVHTDDNATNCAFYEVTTP